MTLAIEIEYLAHRAAAAEYHDAARGGVFEWPPHPARFFAALVAAWGGDDGHESKEESEAEERALEWLEALPPPVVVACGIDRLHIAAPLLYTPTNDRLAKTPRDAIEAIELRSRKARVIPSARFARPDDDEAAATNARAAIDSCASNGARPTRASIAPLLRVCFRARVMSAIRRR